MAVPKRKTSKRKRNQRRSHHALERVNIAFDSVTGEPKLSHHISLKDGYYKGRIAVNKSNKSAVEAADASSDS